MNNNEAFDEHENEQNEQNNAFENILILNMNQ